LKALASPWSRFLPFCCSKTGDKAQERQDHDNPEADRYAKLSQDYYDYFHGGI